MQELGLAALAELVARQLALLLAQVAPQVQVGEEVRVLVGEAGVRLVGLRLLVGRALARVLDRQRGGDHDHLVGAAEPVGLEHHPAQPRVDRQLREPAAERRQLARRRRARRAPAAARSPSRTWRRSGGSRNGKSSTSPRPSAAICRITDGEARAQDLGVGEARARRRSPPRRRGGCRCRRRRAPAAALALVGRGLRDRLDRQPLHLQPRAVAADPRGAGVDDVADARARSATSRRRWWRARRAGRACGWKTRCCSAADSRA